MKLLALALTAAALTAPAAPHHHPQPPGVMTVHATRACIIEVSGTPGIASFTARIDVNPCGIAVRASAGCWPPGGGPPQRGGYYVEGPATRKIPGRGHPSTSKAECGKIAPPLHILPWSFDYRAARTGKWTWVGMGPVPPGPTSVALPPASCAPDASTSPGFRTAWVYFGRNPCYYVFRAVGLCFLEAGGTGSLKKWVNGVSVRVRGRSQSQVDCAPYGPADMAPVGYQWKARAADRHWGYVILWPKEPGTI